MSDHPDYDFRRVPEEEYDVLREFIQYAFWPQNGSNPEDWRRHEDLEQRFGEPYGLYDGRELLCSAHIRTMDARLRGTNQQVGVLSTLAAPPENRRRGFTEPLLRGLDSELSERSVGLAIQWPFDHGFYYQYGYQPAHTITQYQFDPAAVSGVVNDTDGEFRRVSPDDWRDLQSIYQQYVHEYSLPLHRPERWWRNQILAPGVNTMHACVWNRDGEDRGYLVYHVEGGNEGQRLNVHDVAFTDYEAFRHLLTYASYHDTQVETVSLSGPDDVRLLDVATDPGSVEVSTYLGSMVSLTDVEVAVRGTPVSRDADESVVLRVRDPVSVANDGVYRLTAVDGQFTCQSTTQTPDVTLGVGELAQLLVGYHSLTDLAETSTTTNIHDSSAASALDAALPPTKTYLFDQF